MRLYHYRCHTTSGALQRQNTMRQASPTSIMGACLSVTIAVLLQYDLQPMATKSHKFEVLLAIL